MSTLKRTQDSLPLDNSPAILSPWGAMSRPFPARSSKYYHILRASCYTCSPAQKNGLGPAGHPPHLNGNLLHFSLSKPNLNFLLMFFLGVNPARGRKDKNDRGVKTDTGMGEWATRRGSCPRAAFSRNPLSLIRAGFHTEHAPDRPQIRAPFAKERGFVRRCSIVSHD